MGDQWFWSSLGHWTIEGVLKRPSDPSDDFYHYKFIDEQSE
jgi:hypothetical protein